MSKVVSRFHGVKKQHWFCFIPCIDCIAILIRLMFQLQQTNNVIFIHLPDRLRKQLNVNFGLEAFSICNLGAVNGLGMLPQLWVLLLDFVWYCCWMWVLDCCWLIVVILYGIVGLSITFYVLDWVGLRWIEMDWASLSTCPTSLPLKVASTSCDRVHPVPSRALIARTALVDLCTPFETEPQSLRQTDS